MEARVRAKVRVVHERCQGHGRCSAIAPSLFELDDLGHASVRGDGLAEGATLERARLAAENCPERAITIEAAGTSEGRP